MKLWISKNSEVSVSDQLVEQITIGIASRDLQAGEKLPSTREIARRFQIHSNTVLAAYKKLDAIGLVEFRKGSGVYIRSGENGSKPVGLDEMIDEFFLKAAATGFSRREIGERLLGRFEAGISRRFLLVESDIPLSKILSAEIEAATGSSVETISFKEFAASAYVHQDLQITAMFDEREKIGTVLPSGQSCIFLRANSVPTAMSGRTRPSNHDLIATVSGWERFLALARLYLLAANVDADTIVSRSTTSPDWRDGLQSASIIICDLLTATQLPGDERVRIFPLIAESSLEELNATIER